jgi:hypothetical protein
MQSVFAGVLFLLAMASAHAEPLKPFVLANEFSGDEAAVVSVVKVQLADKGFEVVGSYSPYPGATVIAVTNAELKAAAVKAKNGGFGVAQRVAVTEVNGKPQVSYTNPTYMGAAYGLGGLEKTKEAFTAALGNRSEFGAEGIESDRLAPGVYHYSLGMPYFNNLDLLAKYPDQKTAIAAVEKGLAAGKSGAQKVYRVDIPGKDISVYGVGIKEGEGADKLVMSIIDFREPRSTAHLPYEFMVQDGEVISLRARYRIAVNFPDLSMSGKHGFTKIMSAPRGIKNVLEKVANPQ